jgi:hypothetical protein
VGVGAIDVARRGEANPLFAGVTFGRDEGFEAMEPTHAALDVRAADGGQLLATSRAMTFERGGSYGFVVTRDPNGRISVVGFHDMPVHNRALAASTPE